jgi:hypothetical protein
MHNQYSIVASQDQITTAINEFNHKYHHGFFDAIGLAKACYLEGQNQFEPLANCLSNTLNAWGAGKRKAPQVVDVITLADVLSDADFGKLCHELLLGSRCVYGNQHPWRQGDQIIQFLNFVAKYMLIGSTTVTYPMKILLLLTGYMPALDGQVKKGLTLAGAPGFATTSYQLESSAELSMQRIQALPIDLSGLWKQSLHDAVAASQFPKLNDYPGRVFDVLFFHARQRSRSVIDSVFINKGKGNGSKKR